MKRVYSQKGLTLIEIIVSIAILGIISVTFLAVFTNGFSYIAKAGMKGKTLYSSQQNMENSLATNAPGTPFTLSVTFPDGPNIAVSGVKITNGSMTGFIPGDNATLVPVTGFSITPTNLVLPSIGSLNTITATVLPANASNKNITWTSDNSAIASVISGIVKGEGVGTTRITATTVDGNFKAYCNVTVSNISSDATLEFIKIGQQLISGFNSNTFSYTVNGAGNHPPAINAKTNHPGATMTITQAQNGNDSKRTARIVVTAQDGITQKSYSVFFSK